MAIEAIGGITSKQTAAIQPTLIGQDDLIKIMLTELTYQDPLKPLDNREFIAQLAQFTTLAQTQQLNDHVDNLLSIQAATQSLGLIGKTVSVQTSQGASDTGQVTTITFSNGEPRLTVQTAGGAFLTDIGLASVTLIR